LAAYLRRYLATHDKTYADWVPEISEPMFRQLILDGFNRTFATCVLVIATLLASLVIRPSEDNQTSTMIIAIVALGYFLVDWRGQATQCVGREFTYRRRHGKWRWER